MATIQEKVKDKQIVSFKFKACLGRDENGKQIFKCHTWYPPVDCSAMTNTAHYIHLLSGFVGDFQTAVGNCVNADRGGVNRRVGLCNALRTAHTHDTGNVRNGYCRAIAND